MSYGLNAAGVGVRAGLDIDESCRRTYQANIKGGRFVEQDVTTLKVSKLAESLEVQRNDDALVLVGCSPCQFWSKINTDKSKSKLSAHLLNEFARFVTGLRPGWVIIENVPGILNKKGSALPQFLRALTRQGYTAVYEVLDLSRYGVPQTRHRFVLIATRLDVSPSLPQPSSRRVRCVKDVIGERNGFPAVEAGHCDSTTFMHSTSGLAEINLERIKATPHDGGDRRAWQADARLGVAA